MRVLFVGNSHTYFNDMPELFAQMCEKLCGEKPDETMLAYSGQSLGWHRKEYFSLRFALLRGHYDYCVLQQQAHPFPSGDETRAAVKRIITLCLEGGSAPVLFMTWAKKAEPEMREVMSRFYSGLAEETGALLAPIGELFAAAQDAHPEIELYWRDGAHASPYGSWLCAACFAALLCKTRELAALPDDGIDFRLEMRGESGLPVAAEDAEQATVCLDPAKTRLLRQVIESMLPPV